MILTPSSLRITGSGNCVSSSHLVLWLSFHSGLCCLFLVTCYLEFSLVCRLRLGLMSLLGSHPAFLHRHLCRPSLFRSTCENIWGHLFDAWPMYQPGPHTSLALWTQVPLHFSKTTIYISKIDKVSISIQKSRLIYNNEKVAWDQTGQIQILALPFTKCVNW